MYSTLAEVISLCGITQWMYSMLAGVLISLCRNT